MDPDLVAFLRHTATVLKEDDRVGLLFVGPARALSTGGASHFDLDSVRNGGPSEEELNFEAKGHFTNVFQFGRPVRITDRVELAARSRLFRAGAAVGKARKKAGENPVKTAIGATGVGAAAVAAKKRKNKKKKNEEFEVTEDYKEFFRSALQKFGVDNPSKLAGDKKKSFFDYVDKNWKGKKETKEEKKIKLSGKKEKITFNPPVKEDVPAAMGMNPFQRVVDNYNGSSNQEEALNEVFQHTWGYGTPEEVEYREGWMTKFHEYVANEDPQQYVDILQVNAMYSAGARPEEAAKRVLGFRSESSNDFQNRQRRFDLAGVSGEDSDYEDANQWNGDAT